MSAELKVTGTKWVFELNGSTAILEPGFLHWPTKRPVWRVSGLEVPDNLHVDDGDAFVFEANEVEAFQFVKDLLQLEVEYQRAMKEAQGIWASQFHTTYDSLCFTKTEEDSSDE